MIKKILMSFGILTLGVNFAFAQGDIERGKKLFNDPGLGTIGKSCNSCHPGGKGLEGLAAKKEFVIMGKTMKSLEEVINMCIQMGLKGKPLDPKSKNMQDLVAYIKSLAKVKEESPKKKKVEGC
jgi:cytochrome c